MMKDSIKKYQDEKVGFIIEAKRLQIASGFSVALSPDGKQAYSPVGLILKVLLEMTTRED